MQFRENAREEWVANRYNNATPTTSVDHSYQDAAQPPHSVAQCIRHYVLNAYYGVNVPRRAYTYTCFGRDGFG